jgi:nicotinamidase-related amidase
MAMGLALIIVDMMKCFFVRQSEKLEPSPNVEGISRNIRRLVDECHRVKIPVVYSNDAFHPAEAATEPHFKLFGVHGIKGDPLSDVVDLLAPAPTDFVVEKRMYDGFFQTRLDTVLRSLNVDTVIVTGTWTSGCVQHTVLGAWEHCYLPIVVTDAVSCPDEQAHQYALQYMARNYAAKLVSLPEALALIRGAGARMDGTAQS